MQIIPVIDIMNGTAVHAVGGHRQYYQPVQSVVTDSSEPGIVLKAMKRRLRIDQCYVADIDAIQSRQANRCALAEMSRTGVSLLVDAGVRNQADAELLLEINIDRVIVGAETTESADVLRCLTDNLDTDRLIFSVDLRDGELLTANPDWSDTSPLDVAMQAVEAGFTRFIFLDLAAIGTGRGVPTLGLCREFRRRMPNANIIAGGGVRTAMDIDQLEEAGADGALVATAVHNGQLKAEDVRRYARAAVA